MQILDEVKRVLSSKMKGDKWVEAAIIPLVEVAIEIKELESKKKEECEPMRSAIKDVDEKYKQALNVLEEIDTNLRERVMKEHEGTESVRVDGIGELVFSLSKLEIEITDIKKVDPRYITINSQVVREDEKNGIQNFRGLKVTRARVLKVLTKRD